MINIVDMFNQWYLKKLTMKIKIVAGFVRSRNGYSKFGTAASGRPQVRYSDRKFGLGDGGRSDADANTGLGSREALSSVSEWLDASFQERDGDWSWHLRSKHEKASYIRAEEQERKKIIWLEAEEAGEGAKAERTNPEADYTELRRRRSPGQKKRLQKKTREK